MEKLIVPKGYEKTRKQAVELGKLHASNEKEKVRGYVR